ncbi:MAG: hypothetical protein HOV70_29385, partial [Streptomyces sp.]|nr:hypothetical protein [Streptomyces sp.]
MATARQRRCHQRRESVLDVLDGRHAGLWLASASDSSVATCWSTGTIL